MKGNIRQIPMIAITGGPCSGKTTFLSQIQETLLKEGFKVIIIRESATELFSNAIDPLLFKKTVRAHNQLQEIIFREQISRENSFLHLARLQLQLGATEKLVILCDRSTLDGEAYMGPVAFKRMIKKLGYTKQELVHRYTATICLTTAAKGAKKFYTLANNQARTERWEVACQLDEAITQAYLPHEHVHIISNIENGVPITFAEKMNKAKAALLNALGIPFSFEHEVRFLLHEPFSISKLKNYTQGGVVKQQIVQTYLQSTRREYVRRRIRKITMSQPFVSTYYVYTEKEKHGADAISRIERQRLITEEEYRRLQTEADIEKSSIVKDRYYFNYEAGKHEVCRGQLDYTKSPPSAQGRWIFEYESYTPEIRNFSPPAWLGKVTNVTNTLNNAMIAAGEAF